MLLSLGLADLAPGSSWIRGFLFVYDHALSVGMMYIDLWALHLKRESLRNRGSQYLRDQLIYAYESLAEASTGIERSDYLHRRSILLGDRRTAWELRSEGFS